MKKVNLRSTVGIAVLSSLACLLMLIRFPIPPFPSYLTVDFSDIPALLAALVFGPIGAVLVELIKNIINYLMVSSDVGIPIGNAANFVSGLLFVLPTYYIYRHLKTKKGMTIGLITGTVSLAVLMSLLNYFVILPAYFVLANLHIPDVKSYIIAGILPFNIIKGFIVTLVFMLIFTRMQGWIEKRSLI
jgi:riboflavin transporter